MRGKFRTFNGSRRNDPLRFWPEARRKKGWSRYFTLWAGAIGVGLAVGGGWAYWPDETASAVTKPLTIDEYAGQMDSGAGATVQDRGVRAHFISCHVSGGYNCVVDGDTIWLKGVKIRIADIDAPETHDPKCASELQRGNRATERLLQLVNSGTVTIRSIDRDEDRYGRKLRIVMVDGRSVGDTLVGEGLARPYGNGRQPWC